jgi:hypothetical protein
METTLKCVISGGYTHFTTFTKIADILDQFEVCEFVSFIISVT